jgi:hypothetical protein
MQSLVWLWQEFLVCFSLSFLLSPPPTDIFPFFIGDSNSGEIYRENLELVLRILLYGRIEEKVSLFVKFMIHDTSGNIPSDAIQSYLKISSQNTGKIFDKLGLLDEQGKQTNESLRDKDILNLFLSKSTGMTSGTEAINIFCRQILSILTKHLNRKKTKSMFLSLMALTGPPPDSADLFCVTTSSNRWNCQTIFSRIRFFFAPPQLYMFCLLVLQLFLWLYNFLSYHHHGHPICFCVAKGFGLNLRVLTLYLYFTMARSTLNLLSSVPLLKRILSPGDNVSLHSFIGFCTLFHSFGHIAMHIMFQQISRPNGFPQSFKQRSLLKMIFLGSYEDYNDTVLSGDGITGLALFFMIFLISVTALLRGISSSWYTIFSRVHYLYLVWLLLITLHVPPLWPYFAAITFLLLLDRLYDSLFLTIHATLAFSRACSNGVTFLSIPHSQHNFSHAIGSYYRIQIPSLSSLEWHPFSLAGSKTSRHLSFFIASTGDWTRALYELVSNPTTRALTKVKIQGPYYAPAQDALNNPASTILLVASGIGITPFFSVIATKVTG